MNDFITIGAATSPVLVSGRSGEAASARRTVPPVQKVEGTGLPIGGFGTGFVASGVAVVLTGADRVRGATTTVRMPAVAEQGIPPRWRPVRC